MVNMSPMSLWQIAALVATKLFEDPPLRSLRRIFLSENNIRNKHDRCQVTPGIAKSGSGWQFLETPRPTPLEFV
jgi:hypothetical protein